MFKLVVFRPTTRAKNSASGGYTSEWLKGTTLREDLADEAHALLTDPKDSIVSVKVYNEKWGQFEPLTFENGWSYDGTHKCREVEL